MSADTFAALPPVPERVTIGGETLDIAPLRVGDLPAFARAVRPFAHKASADPDWFGIIGEDGEAAIAAVAIACRRPVEWVSGLSLDDAVRLAQAVFEVNADFFVKRLAPEIERASLRINRVIAGAMPSPG